MKYQVMRTLVLTSATLFAFSGCDVGQSEKPEASEQLLGWRSAGLVIPTAQETGGVQRLAHVGEYLFAMDAYTPAQEGNVNQDTAAEPYKWRIWKGRVGSNKWDSLPMPNGNIPNEWVVIGENLYIGTKYSGEIWRYNPTTSTWRKLTFSIKLAGQYSVQVDEYDGELFAGFWSKSSNKNFCWMGGISNISGEYIPCPGRLKNLPPDHALELKGILYGISAQFGIFKYTKGDTAWIRLPSPRGLVWNDDDPTQQLPERVTSIAVHNGKIYLGYRNDHGLYRIESDGSYTNMTPVGAGSLKLIESPSEIRTMLSYQKRLFFAGISGSTPAMYMPKDSTKVQFGDWKLLGEGWCRKSYGCGSQSWGMIGIGDTLYASAWGFVAKIPISQLDSIATDYYPALADTVKQ